MWGGYLQSDSEEALTDIVASAIVGKLSREYDLSIPENVEKAEAVMKELKREIQVLGIGEIWENRGIRKVFSFSR